MNGANPGTVSVAIVAVTKTGAGLGRCLREQLPGSRLYVPEKFAATDREKEHAYSSPVRTVVKQAFARYRSLVLIMAAGIAVRLVSGLPRDKHTDPAVVVVDDAGTFAVSLLSGHAGGANELARKVASLTGAQPVITTASEVNRTLSLDMLGNQFGWTIKEGAKVTAASAALVNSETVALYQDAGEVSWAERLPENVIVCSSLEEMAGSDYSAALVITDRTLDGAVLPANTIVYRPRSLVVGIGCNRGTPCSEIESAVADVFARYGLAEKSIRNLATIDLKKDEAGILEFARKYSLPVAYYPKEALKQVKCPSGPSAVADKYVGTPSVCEAAAMLSSHASLIVSKQGWRRKVTVAVARMQFNEKSTAGKIFLVGLGPGDARHMTFRARQAIEEAEVIVGYDTYVKLIETLVPHKQVIATGMRKEVPRARAAVELASSGKKVAVVCSGDSGIYGMAGLVGEILQGQKGDIPAVEVVPGVPALVASAALLGAPLMGDFAAISLSDYLVSWEQIVRRLELAAQGDFVIVLYNPKSRSRQRQLDEARDILLRHRAPTTPVGIVTSAGREGQQVVITDLAHLPEHEVGMTTTIIVGSSTTFAFKDWMITPRGYTSKYSLSSADE